MDDTDAHTDPRTVPISGTLLRSFLLLELDRAGPAGSVTTAELAAALERDGFTASGRPGKVISDALRWELGKGRARWISRGRYRIGYLPRTTRWRCRRRVEAARSSVGRA